MRRRDLITGLGGAIMLWPLAARAQSNAVPRVGILSANPIQPTNIKAFMQGLGDLGYVEGQNVSIEFRDNARSAELTGLAADLIKARVAVIFANGSEATSAARQMTTDIPIVTISSNPLGLGFVASLARPEGNITGVSLMAPESSGKRLELLKEIVSDLVNIAVFQNPNDPGAVSSAKETENAAEAIGLKPRFFMTPDAKSFNSAFENATEQGAQAVVLLPAPQMGGFMRQIADLALKNRLPTTYLSDILPKAGGLMSYGVDVAALFRRAAYYVDRLLKGAKPTDLPVEQPTRFELVINLKTARALGLAIPSTLLAIANEVIE